MLVLTRKTDESIIIGDDIKVTILSIDDDRVRIGIDAPRSMRIFRQELLKETIDINLQAASVKHFSFKKSGEKDKETT